MVPRKETEDIYRLETALSLLRLKTKPVTLKQKYEMKDDLFHSI